MRVKYLGQEHNAVPRPGLEPGPPDPKSSALTIRQPRLPKIGKPIFGGLRRFFEYLIMLRELADTF